VDAWRVSVPQRETTATANSYEGTCWSPKGGKLVSLRQAFLAAEGLNWTQFRAKYGEKTEDRIHAFVLRNAERV